MNETRIRREPPLFRNVEVASVDAVNEHMTRVLLASPELEDFDAGLPAASVRLLIAPEGCELEIPTWRGNEFLLGDQSRPIIRTLTPVKFGTRPDELALEIVRHGNGPLSLWADRVSVGDRAAISGPGRGYEIDGSARNFLLAGDESALPAIAVLLRALPPSAHVEVLVEVHSATAQIALPSHPGAHVRWLAPSDGDRRGDTMAEAMAEVELCDRMKIWVAGEAAAVQRIRRSLFVDRGVPRSEAVIRGYWKLSRPDT